MQKIYFNDSGLSANKKRESSNGRLILEIGKKQHDTPQSYAYRKIRGKLKDSYVSTGLGPGITYHANGFWFRIDHILYGKGLQSLSTHIDKVKYSDHYPVKAILKWNETDK